MPAGADSSAEVAARCHRSCPPCRSSCRRWCRCRWRSSRRVPSDKPTSSSPPPRTGSGCSSCRRCRGCPRSRVRCLREPTAVPRWRRRRRRSCPPCRSSCRRWCRCRWRSSRRVPSDKPTSSSRPPRTGCGCSSCRRCRGCPTESSATPVGADSSAEVAAPLSPVLARRAPRAAGDGVDVVGGRRGESPATGRRQLAAATNWIRLFVVSAM